MVWLLSYSSHAREQMVVRGISFHEVEEGIQRGAKEFQPPNKTLYHYRYFTVVTKKIEDTIFIITIKPRWRT